MASHFSLLAQEIPWTEKPDGLQSMGMQKIQLQLSDKASTTTSCLLHPPLLAKFYCSTFLCIFPYRTCLIHMPYDARVPSCALLFPFKHLNSTLITCFAFFPPSQIIRSDQISLSVVSDSLRPHESQHARPPCPSPTPGVHSDSRPSSQRCHPAISSSVIPFSSCP